ncbi:MAG TPA: OsmC family protein [Candidatus Limnocylindria bacterium]|nr:OsmC family protein [Candidatus Limnocylindria bacterium]
MKSVTVTLDGEGGRFLASGGHRGQVVVINAPKEAAESRAPTGFSASELLLASAGACSAWDVLEIVRKRRQGLSGLEVTVEGEQAAEPPWQYERITLHFRLGAEGLERGVLERVIRLSCVRYCSVLATLKGVATIAATLELIDATGQSFGRRPISLALEPAEQLEAESGLGPEAVPLADEGET